MPTGLLTHIETIAQIEGVPSILDVVCRVTGMGFAAIAHVTEDRWVCCAVNDQIAFGLKPGGELKVETTICHDIHRSRQPVVISHVAEDEAYYGHPTPAMYGFQSYISVPIVLKDGSFFGTLCAIDPRPARVDTPEVLAMFRLFAELIAFHLEASQRLASSEARLFDERHTSDLREQFIAVLGHDLRNPLASIDAGTRLLLRTPLNAKASGIVDLMRNSVSRMSSLIDDVLDFARGRLGGGLTVNRSGSEPLEPVLRQVIAEFQSINIERVIDAVLELRVPVVCDPVRIAQLFSNLLGNAITHGEAGAPIRVRSTSGDGIFELSVANAGDPIPPGALERLFQPFTRGAVRENQQGLGLGLYIASEIARAHAGTIEVASSSVETRFTFRMPAG